MKKLFILIQDINEGSYYPHYTFDEDWIKKQETLYDDGEISWPSLGCDGDGFHYDIIMVPDHLTLEDMNISDDANNY